MSTHFARPERHPTHAKRRGLATLGGLALVALGLSVATSSGRVPGVGDPPATLQDVWSGDAGWRGTLRAFWARGMMDEWTRLVATGDALRTGAARSSGDLAPRSARAAYLLAFHHAQDAGDIARMLAVAERLERLGEPALAAHARQVARAVADPVNTGR